MVAQAFTTKLPPAAVNRLKIGRYGLLFCYKLVNRHVEQLCPSGGTTGKLIEWKCAECSSRQCGYYMRLPKIISQGKPTVPTMRSTMERKKSPFKQQETLSRTGISCGRNICLDRRERYAQCMIEVPPAVEA